ncbi:hypothetical protein B0I37DRAFT_388979 [Chaetomium sp. MPI-CAGE-AT-0009]|nr:hypothetical protein B0I37DRAFT_388979 [Chaetomium sp. MPI-CAGE-AT-0009]
MDSAYRPITISCHCGTAKQELVARDTQNGFSSLSFCHCDTCRHATGLLYFCPTCGCHVFRARHPSPTAPSEEWEWEVATGTIIDAPEPGRLPEEFHHQHTATTKDGGLSHWLQAPQPSHHTTLPGPPTDNNDTLRASCHCTSITLLITRASASPSPTPNPDSPYPDLMLPYNTTPPSTILNPTHEKWYLRPTPTHPSSSSSSSPAAPSAKETHTHYRYLAGTCACQPCRLTSGFEIQTWAFIPRRNIAIASSSSSTTTPATPSPVSSAGADDTRYQQLDFSHLPAGVPLRKYESSPGRAREFCGVCGATVFWHDTFRPDLIDCGDIYGW